MPPLDDSHLRAIGRVATTAGNVEFCVDELVLRFVGAEINVHPVLTLIAAMPFAQLAGRVRHLAAATLAAESPAHRAVRDWLTEAQQAMEARNDLIHGAWHMQHYVDTGEMATKRVRLARSGARQMTDVTLDQIDDVWRALATVVANAHAMFVMLDKELGRTPG